MGEGFGTFPPICPPWVLCGVMWVWVWVLVWSAAVGWDQCHWARLAAVWRSAVGAVGGPDGDLEEEVVVVNLNGSGEIFRPKSNRTAAPRDTIEKECCLLFSHLYRVEVPPPPLLHFPP